VTTKDGKLVITMSEVQNHDLDFMSGEYVYLDTSLQLLILNLGMVTSWNKLCFMTGYVEVSISLPGTVDAPGFWPGMVCFLCIV
jgi:beta-glucan synthesis-associated protein KRE6